VAWNSVSHCFNSNYDGGMALVRILVDGYSLLHSWPELAAGRARHSAAARDELVSVLTQYQDSLGTPVTIFFDGSGARPHAPSQESRSHIEVLFSGAGRTADDLIERATHRFQAYGEVLVVTDDRAEQDTVIGLGGQVASCGNFLQMLGAELNELAADLKHHNRTEQHRYRHAVKRTIAK
jgi:predicted RNA-binding protein with PIN domain